MMFSNNVVGSDQVGFDFVMKHHQYKALQWRKEEGQAVQSPEKVMVRFWSTVV